MNIKAALLKEHSKEQKGRIVNYIGGDQKLFDKLMILFFDGPYRVTQRAAWVMSYCIDNHPKLITPHFDQLVANLRNTKSDAVKRNILRNLQNLEIPDRLVGKVADACFKILASNQEPIAIKAFSMTVLYNITLKIPELQNELKLLIEDLIPYGSPGIKSRGLKLLKKLEKLSSQ